MTDPTTLVHLEFGTEFLNIMHELSKVDESLFPMDVQEDMALAYIDEFMELNKTTPMGLVWGLLTIVRILSTTHGLTQEELIDLLRNTVSSAKEKYDA
jgi:hypothetical protein